MRDIYGLAQILANKLAGNNQLSEVFIDPGQSVKGRASGEQ